MRNCVRNLVRRYKLAMESASEHPPIQEEEDTSPADGNGEIGKGPTDGGDTPEVNTTTFSGESCENGDRKSTDANSHDANHVCASNGDVEHKKGEPHEGARENSKDSSPEPSTESVDSFDSKTGNTQLHTAAMSFDKKAVLACLQNKASVDRTNFKHRTAFHEMALSYLLLDMIGQAEKRKTFMDITSKLIDHGLDVNDRDDAGKTPLHYAAPYPEQDELVNYFLGKDLDCTITDGLHQTALHLAVATGSMAPVTLLVDKSHADKKSNELVNAVDVSGQTVIHIAAKGKGKSRMISYLSRHGAALNRRDKGGRTPLHLAAKAGRVENVEVLLDCGARIYEVDVSGQTPVHFAAAHDITGKALACLLPKAGSEILDQQDDVYRQTALHKAIQYQMLENVKVMLRFKPNPNIQDIMGETALHKAYNCSEIFVWKFLLLTRGDMDLPNHAALSPYQKAYKAKNYTAVAVMDQNRPREV